MFVWEGDFRSFWRPFCEDIASRGVDLHALLAEATRRPVCLRTALAMSVMEQHVAWGARLEAAVRGRWLWMAGREKHREGWGRFKAKGGLKEKPNCSFAAAASWAMTAMIYWTMIDIFRQGRFVLSCYSNTSVARCSMSASACFPNPTWPGPKECIASHNRPNNVMVTFNWKFHSQQCGLQQGYLRSKQIGSESVTPKIFVWR